MRLPILQILILLAASTLPVGATGFTLNDIEFWAGEGESQAGIAIDWNGDDLPPGDDTLAGAAPSLVWGYRWDGTATAEQALRDTLATDPRLFGKLAGGGGFGTALLGLGYDLNNDGLFAVDPAEPFDAATGLSLNTDETFANSSDSADAYEEGFGFNLADPDNEGFWHFGLTSGPEASGWVSSGSGVSTTTLQADTFIGFAFTPSFNLGPNGAFANNLIAADPPLLVGALPGDFNGDDAVNAADFVVARDTPDNAAAIAEFRANFGAGLPAAVAVTAVPEPTAALCLMALLSVSGAAWRRRPAF